MYLFVVYFSFAPVISASSHRYVNYFDIQVLMMVTETKMLTSTLHHNIYSPIWIMFFLLPTQICIILPMCTQEQNSLLCYINVKLLSLRYKLSKNS